MCLNLLLQGNQRYAIPRIMGGTGRGGNCEGMLQLLRLTISLVLQIKSVIAKAGLNMLE